MQPSPALERVYADAEKRLGRPLSSSERRIDIAGYDADLEEGKRRLAEAIEKEKRRVIREALAGRYARMQLTGEMQKALEWLHWRGVQHAHAELRAAGVEPTREYAVPRGLRGLLELLTGMLGSIGRRITLEIAVRTEGPKKQVQAELTGAVRDALAKAVEKRVPGALAAAADLVSSAMARGLEEGFSLDAELFQWWEYSAVMDGATCAPCRALDGTRYPSWAAIMVVLPNGGPNPLCLGGGRCRCRPVPGELAALE